MTGMRRREFLEVLGIGAAGSLIAANTAAADTQIKSTQKQRVEFAKSLSPNPMDIRIAVKPVYAPLIHSAVWQGPCRPGGEEPDEEKTAYYLINDPAALWSVVGNKTPEQEKAAAEAGVKEFVKELKANLTSDIRLLDPFMMEYSETFSFSPEQIAGLEQDKDEVDVYIVTGGLANNYTATVIAETIKKPVVIPSGHFVSRDAVAYLKSKGLEGHAAFNAPGINHLLSLLKARKVLQNTNILIITDRGLPPIPVRSCMDVNMLKDKFGIGSHLVSYSEFVKTMDEVINSKEYSLKAQDSAEKLIKNAAETHIDKQHVKRSFEFYYAVKSLMQKYNCNAFSVECFEFCAARIADKYQITPCLVHTLLKDQGNASACEADLNALLAMRLLMSVSNKSSFMGNSIALAKNQLVINHSVPGIKMAGYDKPDLPYDLRHFVESGWGTKVMIDFTKLEEKTVTLARLNPLGTKIYLAKGEVIACSGFNKGTLIGCSLAAHIKVPDAPECLRKLDDFGSHLAMVYGDYTKEIYELADMMGMEVVYAT